MRRVHIQHSYHNLFSKTKRSATDGDPDQQLCPHNSYQQYEAKTVRQPLSSQFCPSTVIYSSEHFRSPAVAIT